IDNRLRSKSMNAAVFQTEDVPSQMESADLTSPIGQQLVGSNRTIEHLIDVVRGLRFSVYLGAPVVSKFAQIDPGTGKLSELTKGILLTSGSGVDINKHGIPPVCANLVFVKIPYTTRSKWTSLPTLRQAFYDAGRNGDYWLEGHCPKGQCPQGHILCGCAMSYSPAHSDIG